MPFMYKDLLFPLFCNTLFPKGLQIPERRSRVTFNGSAFPWGKSASEGYE